jgi:hypothetical protein
MTWTSTLEKFPYSFSMINLVKLLPEWSWEVFDQVMAQAGTNRVELVPSMIFGVDWDQQINDEKGPVRQALERLLEHYKVESIQSLTYGLPINLAAPLIDQPELRTRLEALAVLGKLTSCSLLILGSPGQKKRLSPGMSLAEHKERFVENCSWIAHTLGPEMILSLEHNTIAQGAEYCNTLSDIADVVTRLRSSGLINVGLNLDTKCLVHEFGEDVQVNRLLTESTLSELLSSIQVSYNFLVRSVAHSTADRHQLCTLARSRGLPLSLEEFGLLESQLLPYIAAWNK